MVTVLFILSVGAFLKGSASVSRLPSNGDIILNGSINATRGPLEVFYNDQFHLVCYSSGFNRHAADIACRQLGLGPARNFSAIDTGPTNSEGSGDEPYDGGNRVPVFSITSCPESVHNHILRCQYSFGPPNTDCDHSNDVFLECDPPPDSEPYLGEVRLYNGTYKSRGLLQVYLNNEWGSVCIEKFNEGFGDVVCRQLGYTNVVGYGRYRWVNNERIVWLRDLKCNTTEQTCFKYCYKTPSIRNIYCGNVDDVELECTFDTSLADNSDAGNKSSCEIVIRRVHVSVIVILILIFCSVFLLYAILFIGRFITAAWHKSERYKVQEPERRFRFSEYHEKLKKNSLQLSDSYMESVRKSGVTNVQPQDVIIENRDQEEKFSDD